MTEVPEVSNVVRAHPSSKPCSVLPMKNGLNHFACEIEGYRIKELAEGVGKHLNVGDCRLR